MMIMFNQLKNAVHFFTLYLLVYTTTIPPNYTQNTTTAKTNKNRMSSSPHTPSLDPIVQPPSEVHTPIVNMSDFTTQLTKRLTNISSSLKDGTDIQNITPSSSTSPPSLLPLDLNNNPSNIQSDKAHLKPDSAIPQQLCTISGEELLFRTLQRDDCELGYMQLLGQLTSVTENPVAFRQQFDRLTPEYIIIVVEHVGTKKIVGTGTLLLEKKFIRNFGHVGHIEDIVVDSQFRRCGVGFTLVNTLSELGRKLGCYKTILDCSHQNQTFYEKCGFENRGVQMSVYY